MTSQNAPILASNIFNTEKTDYGQTATGSMFLGQAPGLFDTVNRTYPKIWDLYKTMKSLDWDELEFDFSSSNLTFKTCHPDVAEVMIDTLTWQWEADSVAANTLLPVMAPFISAPELQALYGRITDNEVLHAATYSEIVRCSFDDPKAVLHKVLEAKEAMQRLATVGKVLSGLKTKSLQYAMGLISADDDDLYDNILLGEFAFLVLERVQFMASFAVTFAIGETGLFMPIAKAVQKICQDEFEVHAESHFAVLKHELSTDRGRASWKRVHKIALAMLNEVIVSELSWSDRVLRKEPLLGLRSSNLKQYVLHSARAVSDNFSMLLPEYTLPKKQPLAYMDRWVDIAKTQASPQEQQNGQYKVNLIHRNDVGIVYAADF